MLSKRKTIPGWLLFGLAFIWYLHSVWSGNLPQKINGIVAPRFTQTVVRPLALLSTIYYAGLTQNLHVIGQGGLSDCHLVNQDASTLLATAEQLQNGKPLFIAERLEYLGVFMMCTFQVSSPQIKLS